MSLLPILDERLYFNWDLNKLHSTSRLICSSSTWFASYCITETLQCLLDELTYFSSLELLKIYRTNLFKFSIRKNKYEQYIERIIIFVHFLNRTCSLNDYRQIKFERYLVSNFEFLCNNFLGINRYWIVLCNKFEIHLFLR